MNIKRSLLLIALILGVTTASMTGQSFFTPDDRIVNGFVRKLSGTDFEYHSCIPGLRESILVRATGGKDVMEWETAATPEAKGKKYAAYVWIAALGSGPGTARMDLSVNGEHSLPFFTDGRRSWDIEGSGGVMLSFRAIMTDQHGDHHGYMILRIPAGTTPEGEPLRLKVAGSASDLSSWYMTYRKPVETGVTLNAFPAMLRNQGKPLQLVEAAIFYFGDETEASIYADGKLIAETMLRFGYNAVNLGLPAVKKPRVIRLKIVAGDFSAARTVTLEPVREWHISFIQHAHTDIGYTRPQNEILAEHLRYIDYALDYCDATDSFPDNARFRWTCEASWPVDEYLRCRPQEQRERLIQRIREGRIEVTGMYFNFDELPDEQILAASLQAVGRIKEQGIPVTVAMQNDVNGIGWCLNDFYDGLGVKYLNMGTHGHRALICFDRPTLFWWESPSGKRMLAFRAEHYMTGNTVMEVQSGDIDKFKNNLLNYLISLEAKGYPYDRMAIQHSGYLTDNSPPSTSMSEMILKWNDIFEWPKLTTSTAESFFTQMERGHGDQFPVIRGAWPDWWTDGFGASAREVAATRNAAVELMANTGGLSMAVLAGMSLPEESAEKSALANEALLFYTEHTTGYSESVREPYSQPTMEQRALKESYAWEAVRRTASLGEAAMGLLQSMFEREKEPSLVVFNTLSWKRSALATIYIDHQIVPRGMRAGIYDHEGNRMASQPLSSRSDGTYWAVWVSELPAFGYKKFIIRPEPEEKMSTLPPGEEIASVLPQSEEIASVPPDSKGKAPTLPQKEKTLSSLSHTDEPLPPPYRGSIMENRWYRIVTDNSSGIIKSVFDKELVKELVDTASRHAMGEFILEQLGNRSQMENKTLNDFRRSPLDTVWFDSVSEGEVWNSIRFYGESETAIGPRGYSFEIRLFNTSKRIDLSCSITKKSITDPESFYIAFPFAVENGIHFTEIAGGVIRTGTDQIPGSSNDWYTVQNFTAVRNSQMQVVMGSGEMPLMQFGAINTGRYKAGALPQTTHIYSWPMNNYWVTNFNADQRGGHSWSYYLTSSEDNSDSFATRFGWGARVPLLTRIIPGAGQGDERWGGAFIEGWPSGVVLVNARPGADGKSVFIQLRETGGEERSLSLTNGFTGAPLTLREVDVTGNPVAGPSVKIGPLESKFYEIILH